VFTQVPPNSLRSMIATFRPAATNRRAKAGPDCPLPMIIASKFGMMDLRLPLVFQIVIRNPGSKESSVDTFVRPLPEA
jgi:hypothetical protein